MKKRIRDRGKKKDKKIPNRPNCIFRNRTVSEFPEIKLGTGLEIKRREKR